MARRDGVYTRKDRPGYWISWSDAQGRRRHRKTSAQTLAQARNARAGELVRVEQAKVLGFNPPGEETFREVGDRYIAHQKVRLTPNAFERERESLKATSPRSSAEGLRRSGDWTFNDM